jgi:hypothetical protein
MWLKWIKILMGLCIMCHIAIAQTPSVLPLDTVYTRNLEPLNAHFLLTLNKPIIFVSTTNCGSCVNYFIEKQKDFVFLFLINGKSLLEAQRMISFYKLKTNAVYFFNASQLLNFKEVISEQPTPCLYSYFNQKGVFYTYEETTNVTEEFSLSTKKLKTRLKK